MAVERRWRFSTVMKETYRTHRRRARDRSREHAQKFAEDWRSRFGDASRIWGSPEGGPPEPLSEYTLERRAARATAQGVAMPLGMLDDPTLPHVATYGQIKDSIRVEKQADVERGWATDIRYAVFTDHPLFPLNEYGIGVPQRMTLAPARAEVASRFRHEVVDDFGDAVDEVADRLGGRRGRR